MSENFVYHELQRFPLPEARKALIWLLKATSGKIRPILQLVHVLRPNVWQTTDGFRIHRLRFETKRWEGRGILLEPGVYRMNLNGTMLETERVMVMSDEPGSSAEIEPHYPNLHAALQHGGGCLHIKAVEGGELVNAQMAAFTINAEFATEALSMPVSGISDFDAVRVTLTDRLFLYGANIDLGMDFLALIMPMSNGYGNEEPMIPYLTQLSGLSLQTLSETQEGGAA